jgi:hypothetical protein
MKDYSSRPLTLKLGIREGSTLALLHAPRDVVLDVPSSATVRRMAKGHVDVVVAFFSSSSKIQEKIETLGTMIFPEGRLWIAWPKRASGITTNLKDHVIRDLALPLGLVDNKVCSIDETWTALQLVWRKDRRMAPGASPSSEF